jgi:hypothetical protein
VSPILVRPVREQLEHDRLIRFLLLNKYKRRYEAAGNTGDERIASVKVGSAILFPDIVLTEGKKVAGVVEVETGESVNNLEALAEWVHFSKARVPFYLYVPVASYDSARRLCELRHIRPAEIWTYRPAMDGFDLMRVHQNPAIAAAAARAAIAPSQAKPEATVLAAAPPKPKAPEKKAVKAAPKPVTPAKAPKVTQGNTKGKPKAAAKGNATGSTKGNTKGSTKGNSKGSTKGNTKGNARGKKTR